MSKLIKRELVDRKVTFYAPKYVGQVRMLDGTILVKYERQPNIWHRFWHRFFLGWKFERI